MKKKIYIAMFFVAPIVCFLLAWVTKMPIYGGCIDASDIAVFVVSIICGPWVGLTCGVGVALSDIVCGGYTIAIFSGIISSVVGVACGYLYKHTFVSFSVRACKILAILCAYGVSTVLWAGASFLVIKDAYSALMLVLLKALIGLCCALLAYFILPKVPHIFDDERWNKDNNC
ncbi:MAG: hypothetical protein E7353_07440 [Clostridiales bacterium]|nr:hypothetical protein [Clostridiales bacterium]